MAGVALVVLGWLLGEALAAHPDSSDALAFPIPSLTAYVEVVEDLDIAERALSSAVSISSISAFLPERPNTTFVDEVNETVWTPEVCTELDQPDCVWRGAHYFVRYLDANLTEVGRYEIDVPSACTIRIEEWTRVDDLWCLGASIEGNVTAAHFGIFGDVLEAPNHPSVVQREIFDVRDSISINNSNDSNTFEVCELVPVGRYHIWIGTGVALCRTTVVAPPIPVMTTPVLVRDIPLSRGTSSISFYFQIPNQTAEIDEVQVHYVDTVGNLTHVSVWSGASIVPTVQPNYTGIVHRTFITNFGNPVVPNTEYRMRVAVSGPAGSPYTNFSEELVASTLPTVQPKPPQPLVTEINNTHHNLTAEPLREYGDTSQIIFRFFVADSSSLQGRLISNETCAWPCDGGVPVTDAFLRRNDGVVFITVAVVNQLGESVQSDFTTLRARPLPAKGSSGLSEGGIVGIVCSVFFSMVIYALGALYVRQKNKIEYVTVTRPPPSEAEVTDKDFVRIKEIGVGSSAVVYMGNMLGENNAVVSEVAIKEIHASADLHMQENFLREQAALLHLDHPNVVKLMGVVSQKSPMVILTEFCALGSLDVYLRENKPEPDEALYNWAHEMVLALDYLHSKTIIHRDIACRNYLLTRDRIIKICDLGMCKNVVQYQQKTDAFMEVRWAAPPCFRGDYSRGTDVWALCVAYWELYSKGRLPYYEHKRPQDVYAAVAGGERLTIPETTPAELGAIMVAVWNNTQELRNVSTRVFHEVWDDVGELPQLALEGEATDGEEEGEDLALLPLEGGGAAAPDGDGVEFVV